MGRISAVLFALATGCAGTSERPPDYARPYNVLLTEYAVPVVLAAASPGSVGGWDEGISLKRWVKGVTRRPVAHDVDNDFVNYVLHPVSGSETHMMARNHGWSLGEAALFDAFGSLMWEYVFENVYEPPSRTDLLVTAPIGALLGELRWQAKRAGAPTWLVDPLGDHGEPFLELSPDGLLFGLERKF
ncbi:MAG TPA: DUF3943 domain-containing protein [Planctomycetota bacterium]